jgi:hypothetical protein
MDALLHEYTATGVDGGTARPFRTDAGELVAMFQIPDAGTPTWHRARARTLIRDARLHPLSGAADGWRRLAARHVATAVLLERQARPAPGPYDPVARDQRFFRSRF